MSTNTYIQFPTIGGGGQSITLYNTVADLPVTASDGTLAEVLATHALYVYVSDRDGWSQIDGPEVFNGTFTLFVDNVTGDDSTPNGCYLKPYLTFAAALTAAISFASEAHPVVIQLREGAFTGVNCALPPFVSIYGSGKGITTLTLSGTLSASAGWSTPPVGTYNIATIRDLTLSCFAFNITVSPTVSNYFYFENVDYRLNGAETVIFSGFQNGTINNCSFGTQVRYIACDFQSTSNYYANLVKVASYTVASALIGNVTQMSFTGDFFKAAVSVLSLTGPPLYLVTAYFASCNFYASNSLSGDGSHTLIVYDSSVPYPSFTNGSGGLKSTLSQTIEQSSTSYSSNTVMSQSDLGQIIFLTTGCVVTLPSPIGLVNGILEFTVPLSETQECMIMTPMGVFGTISKTFIIMYPGDSIRVCTDSISGYQILASNLTDNAMRFVKYSLTSSDILNLFTTPITLIPAPGTNRAITIVSWYMQYYHITTAYSGGGNLSLVAGAVDLVTPQPPNLLTSFAANTFYRPSSPTTIGLTVASSAYINSAVTLKNASGAFTGGDGTLEVYVYYMVTATN